MGTRYPDLFAALAAPFEPHEVKQKPAARNSDVKLHYVTARTVMNRLDSVLGPENWWDEYVPTDHSVLCKLSIRLPDGTVLTKQDAGGYAGMEMRTRNGEMVRDDENDEKSGYSDAFKRAAAKLGVARYLYRDGVPDFARARQPSAGPATSPPAREPGSDDDQPSRHDYRSQAPARQGGGQGQRTPRSGKALFAWAKDHDTQHGTDVVKRLQDWGKRVGFPARMIDWDEDQVAQGYEVASRNLEPAGA